MNTGKILTTEAAAILNTSPQFIRVAMQQNKLPIGIAVKMSTKWTYNISGKLLEEYSGKDVEKELEQIRCEDEETGRNLYETLYWYLRMKRNVSQTAAKLKIHRNTLLPRLTRLNDMLDLDNRDGVECEKLLVAMEIERMKNSDE